MIRSALLLPVLAALLPAIAAPRPEQVALGVPESDVTPSVPVKKQPRPLVVWHGLGDTAHSEGMDDFADYVRDKHPGIFVHAVISPTDGTPSDESRAGWWGVADELAVQGCEQITAIPELADGFDAIGLSQGGLFLRWYAQYCDGPKIRNLITFGTPHFGIAALIPCPDPPTLACTLAARAAKAGIYTPWAQSHLIQAQYYRDPARMEEFLQANTFIRDLNGEGGKESPGRGLSSIENIIAIAFDEDTTVVPGESAHWATLDPHNTSHIIPLQEQDIYVHDVIGLKRLDGAHRLHLDWCPGRHMEISKGCAERVVEKWVGST